MFWNRKLDNWMQSVGSRISVPARLALWDGRHFDLGRLGEPQILLRVNEARAVNCLFAPSLERLGEAYIKGAIDIEGPLNKVVELAYDLAAKGMNGIRLPGLTPAFGHTRSDDKLAIQYHYDVSDEFYACWLDPGMVYSCAYFEQGSEDLASAQLRKIDHILTKLKLRPGHTLLDIGCGWGTLAIRAAQKFGAQCVGVTLSQNQYQYAMAKVRSAKLQDKVDIRLQDYRDVAGTFDRISSVGMFEHVGIKHLPGYFGRIRELLADDGLALNHGITSTDALNGDTPFGGGKFIDRYVFPGGELPQIGHALTTMAQGGLEVLDVENLRRHYLHTLIAWSANFEQRHDTIRALVGEEKLRIWRIYLAGCAHAFRHDLIAIYQVLCQKAGRNADQMDWSRRYMYAGEPSEAERNKRQ